MTRVEKTVFISYRRKDISWALAVYQYLTSQKYDVFFDFSSLSSGDFGQVIVSNIKARAHFVLILTPTALDRCNEPGDWLRREIEIAIDDKRNIIPLFFDSFSFGSPSVAEKLTDKLTTLNHYNGLDIPSGYFMEGMERLRSRYLNVPLNAVLHPMPTQVRKVVKEEQIAADKALRQSKDVKEIVKPATEISNKESSIQDKKAAHSPLLYASGARGEGAGEAISKSERKKTDFRSFGIGAGIFLIATLGIFGINLLIQTTSKKDTPTPTERPSVSTSTSPATETSIPPTPTLVGIGKPMTSPKDGMILLYVPAGEFTMGSDNGSDDEKPVHTVYLDAYWIDQTEVTNAMYAKCVNDGGCKEPANASSYTHPSYYGNSEFANYPVIYVSWNDALAYCTWSGRKLPTEAEWEKAARGENVNIYPWGNEAPNKDLLNYNGDIGDTTEVGKYPNGKSIYGALDMAGNVWEWVSSLSQPYPYSADDGRENLSSLEARVLRGGSWDGSDNFVRSADRSRNVPATTAIFLGFRCSRSQ